MIPILKVNLPDAERLHKYLLQIDRNSTYSNFGPLVLQLEEKLANYLTPIDCIPPTINSFSSATSALQCCLIGIAKKRNKPIESLTVALPNWTFTATGLAPLSLGCQIRLLDCDESGSIDLKIVKQILEQENIDVLIPVMPFGGSLDTIALMKIQQIFAVDILIDGAAAFFNISNALLNFNVIVSTHATKGFSTGEGGILITQDIKFSSICKAVSNFGFSGKRSSQLVGMNSKMSEYHAAVGLASLEIVQKTRIHLLDVVTNYHKSIEKVNRGILGNSKFIIKPLNDIFPRTTMNVVIKSKNNTLLSANHADKLISSLNEMYSIQCRRWWPSILSEMPAFSDSNCVIYKKQKEIYPVHQATVGLPMNENLKPNQVLEVVSSVAECLIGIENG